MRICSSGNAPMQALSHSADILLIVGIVESDRRFLPVVAAILRDHIGKQPAQLTQSLRGASRVLIGLMGNPANPTGIPSQVQHLIDAIQRLYSTARNNEDANSRRAKVLELLVYRRIECAYATGDCLMDCVVFARANSAHAVTMQEVDVCAWDEAGAFGEAYECKVKPTGFTITECENLLLIEEECRDYRAWLRLGLASLETTRKLAFQLDKLAQARGDPDRYEAIETYGWDRMEALRE